MAAPAQAPGPTYSVLRPELGVTTYIYFTDSFIYFTDSRRRTSWNTTLVATNPVLLGSFIVANFNCLGELTLEHAT